MVIANMYKRGKGGEKIFFIQGTIHPRANPVYDKNCFTRLFQ